MQAADDIHVTKQDPASVIQRALAGKGSDPELPARPRRSLAGRMLRWMFAIAITPAIICMVMFNQTVQDYLQRKHQQDGETLGKVVAASLVNRVDHFARNPGELLDGLGRDPRIAFVCVTDPRGKLLHAGVFDDKAWRGFGGVKPSKEGDTVVAVQETLSAGIFDQVVVQTVPIIDPPMAWDNDGNPIRTGEPRLQGYVVLAIRDAGIQHAIMSFQAAQILTVVVVCAIALPVVALILRRWVKPWRDLVLATRRLAAGSHIEPVAVRSDDEIGYLAAAFNDMAGRLVHKQRELEDANADLEKKVRQRTYELQIEKEKLEAAAFTDQLTGLPNRRAFSQEMDKHFPEARTYGGDLCVLVIDLDGFKGVNDTYGHDKGDELLKLAASCMRKHAKRNHTPARMGGDEFLMLMPKTDLQAAAKVANLIREDFIRDSRELLGPDATVRVSMSQGLANIAQARPDTSVQLVAQADKAVYAAKAAGKSCLVVFDPATEELAHAA